MSIEDKVAQYETFRLETDLSVLSEAERQMVPLLIAASKEMDTVFWQQAYGDRDELLASLESDAQRRYAEINYGPWDRLDGDAPFIDGVGPKPPGANFYPADATREEIEAAAERGEEILSLYSIVRRDEEGGLQAIPYSEAYGEHYRRAAGLLRQAAELAPEHSLRTYLTLRADALESDEYQASDMAWMDMKDNRLDVVIGPIESYEDGLFGLKTASEGYVLVKDREWSDRLQRYAALLPDLQRGLPVDAAYKSEMPGSDSDLGAYDAVYYAGDCNAGSKTIAINLPNDETVQLEKGARRLQLKNAMRAKFEKIMLPISDMLIAEDQRQHVTFDAFFGNTMFHEVAHGLGIKQTIDGSSSVREALGEYASAIEEGKADMLGVYMVIQLAERGELGPDVDLRDNFVTFLAGIFRSVRFGSSSAHGIANLMRFNFFEEMGAFSRDESGVYRVDEPRLRQAAEALSAKILTLQGDGDRQAVADFVERYGSLSDGLQADLDRLAEAGIPVDIVFEQGVEVLGLEGVEN
ncbi:MAG: Zn-dependent hydrolase [Acidobacteriota bacterium]